MAAAATRTEEKFGAVHLVCNNAGVGGVGPLDQSSYDDWDWVLGVNLGGVINGVQTFVRRMKEHGEGGHFVNTASMAGLLASGSLGVYNTSKFAVVGLSEALRRDMEPYGVGVSVLCPGFVATHIMESRRNRPQRYAVEWQPDAEVREMWESALLAGLDPVEVGTAVRDAVLANELWIFTHPEFKPLVAEHHQAILDAFKEEPDAEKVETLKAFGKRDT